MFDSKANDASADRNRHRDSEPIPETNPNRNRSTKRYPCETRAMSTTQSGLKFDIHAVTGPMTDAAMILEELPKLPADEYEALQPMLEKLPEQIRSCIRRLEGRAEYLKNKVAP